MEEKEQKVERRYKDTLFRCIFSDRKNLLSLYNAVNGTHHDNPDELEIWTLDNAIYMNVKNDVSFLFQFRLSLYEHQSTVNPNMPLRDLLYISKQYQRYIEEEHPEKGALSIYSSSLMKIPTPKFVVFYNGAEEMPERYERKLSDAYQLLAEDPALELKVLVLNINHGMNQELLEACQILKEYCQYVEKVRNHRVNYSIEEAVERAVDECIREGVLADFLRSQRAEAIAMSIFEYNEEEELKKIRKSEYSVGKEEGRAEGRAEAILEVLSLYGIVDENLDKRIMDESNVEVLSKWHLLAVKVKDIEEFKEQMDK